MQICSKCKRELPDEMFSKDSHRKSGLQSRCKECQSAVNKAYRAANREKISKYNKEYQQTHKEKIRALHEKYMAENAETIKERCKKYRDAHKKERNAACAEWYQKNKEYVSMKNKERRQAKKAERNAYERNKKKTDEFYRFKAHIRHFMWESFQRKSWNKNEYTQKIIGCTFEEAKAHLEQTFFENYGYPYDGETVHIDHIIPLSVAKSEEEVLKLCHISNLQYLRPHDNIVKRDKNVTGA